MCHRCEDPPGLWLIAYCLLLIAYRLSLTGSSHFNFSDMTGLLELAVADYIERLICGSARHGIPLITFTGGGPLCN